MTTSADGVIDGFRFFRLKRRFLLSPIRPLILLVLTALPLVLSAAAPDAEALMENGHWKRARVLAEAAFRAHPQDARSAYVLSRVRTQYGEIDDALKYAQLAVQLDPKNVDYHLQLAQAYGDEAQRASILRQFSWARKCRAEIEAALALDPKNIESLDAQMNWDLEAPGILGGDKKKASALAEEITRINPSRGYMEQAQILKKETGDEGRAVFLYQKAVETDPRNYDALTSLLNYYLDPLHSNLSIAEKYAGQALRANPDRVEGYCFLVRIFVRLKRTNDVGDVLHSAEKAIPDNLAPYFFAGNEMLQQGSDLDRAASYFKKYLTQAPEPRWPSQANVHWSIGLVYEKQGEKIKARSEMELALQLQPDFEPAKQELKRLK